MMSTNSFTDMAKERHETPEAFTMHHSNSGYSIYFHDKNTASAFTRGVIIVTMIPGDDYAWENQTPAEWCTALSSGPEKVTITI
ncbi:hypothetical protein [Acaryochloris marina]|uniref:hypothetical protein n=1 Tax=Acaryochloris marina TaxID=155978 RepID=UPI0005A06C8E|nr:hypothetical protein [Acaryochloris marina]BDM81167.1 hypothetical protein AM10699_40340 [Acaryochloris marina MBIC10699]